MTIQLTPGTMTTSQRRAQLEEIRFLDIRNLAYITYKKPDGSPLLTYEETLNDRAAVRLAVLQYEIANNALIPDGTEQQTHVDVVPPAAQNPGNIQMTTPFPQPGQMPQQAFAAPPGVQAPPQFAPPQASAQQPLPFAAPNPFGAQPGAPVATPVAQAPAPQAAPEAAPEGRKRRGRPPANAAQGTAVAPPPAAPPPTPDQQPPFAPPYQDVNQAPQFTQQAPQAAPAPSFAAPSFAAPQGAPPPMFATQAPVGAAGFNTAPQTGPTAQGNAPAATVDLSPAIGRLDDIGKMVSGLTAEIAALKQQNTQLVETTNFLLVAVSHQYFTNPALAQMLQQGNVQQNTAAFRDYLKKFVTP